MRDLGVAAALALVWLGCTYDPPPTVTLQEIDGRERTLEDPVVLLFDEAIDPDTLELRILANDRDGEGELRPGATVYVDWCRVGRPCGGDTLRYDAGALTATVHPEASQLGPPLTPLLIEVSGRLEDLEGNDLHRPERFELIYSPVAAAPVDGGVPGDGGAQGCEDPVTPLESGKYVFVAPIEQPVSIVQSFYVDVAVDPCTGRFVAVGSDADPTAGSEGRGVDDFDLDRFGVDVGPETAYSVFFQGTSRVSGDLVTFQSEPFSYEFIAAPAGTPIASLAIENARITGRVVSAEGEPRRLEGQFSVESIEFILVGQDMGSTYENESTDFGMLEVPPEQWPAEAVEVCSPRPDPCARAVFVCENGALGVAAQDEVCPPL